MAASRTKKSLEKKQAAVLEAKLELEKFIYDNHKVVAELARRLATLQRTLEDYKDAIRKHIEVTGEPKYVDPICHIVGSYVDAARSYDVPKLMQSGIPWRDVLERAFDREVVYKLKDAAALDLLIRDGKLSLPLLKEATREKKRKPRVSVQDPFLKDPLTAIPPKVGD